MGNSILHSYKHTHTHTHTQEGGGHLVGCINKHMLKVFFFLFLASPEFGCSLFIACKLNFLRVERLVGLACLYLDGFVGTIEYTLNFVISTSLMSLLLLYPKSQGNGFLSLNPTPRCHISLPYIMGFDIIISHPRI
jgi:hypothetical protein